MICINDCGTRFRPFVHGRADRKKPIMARLRGNPSSLVSYRVSLNGKIAESEPAMLAYCTSYGSFDAFDTLKQFKRLS
jgi:hypothetical protein